MQRRADDVEATQPLRDDPFEVDAVPQESTADGAADGAAGDPLPTMANLDQVASELDDIDAQLTALDEQRP